MGEDLRSTSRAGSHGDTPPASGHLQQHVWKIKKKNKKKHIASQRVPDLIADKKKKIKGRARHLEQTQKLMWCQKLKKKTEREREREREQISSARLCISIHTMGLSQRLRLFLCYYMLLERANKRKLPQKISPDGSYQRHLHRQIKWAISLKTICMFPACYESALCQANSQFLNAQNIMRKKKYLTFLLSSTAL